MAKGKRRTLYGYDNKIRSTVRIVGTESTVQFVIDNKPASFKVFDELGNILAKKKSILFQKSGTSTITLNDEKTEVAYGLLKDGVVSKLPKTANITFYMLGYDMDLSKADEYVKKLLKQTKAENSKPAPEETPEEKKEKVQLGMVVDKFFNLKSLMDEVGGKVENAKTILKNVCIDGEVFTSGKKKLAVLIGEVEGRWTLDREKMKKDGIYDKYKMPAETNFVLTISDGNKKEKNSKMDESQIKREQYTDKQLYTLADGINKNDEILKQNKYKLEDIRQLLITKMGEGEQVVSFNDKDYIVKISKRAGIPPINEEQMKIDGIYNDYRKKQDSIKYLTIKTLIG